MTAFTVAGRRPDGGGVRVVVEDGRIAELEATQVTPDAPVLLPGLVDAQVNGYGGFDLNGAAVSPAAVVGLVDALARVGTTTVVPTVITGSQERMEASLRAIAEAVAAQPAVARAIPFVHLEGPWLSEVDGPRGAHELAEVRPPDLREFDAWQRAAAGLVGMVTLSPHHPGVRDHIAALVRRGVRVAVGHTHCAAEEIGRAVDAGARYSTHLGNGIQAQLPRHPNAIWAQLADDRLTAGFIADGHHLPDQALRAMIRAKGIERSFVVSDSVALAGARPGVYDAPVGGAVELHRDGRLNVAGTPYLAGAALPLVAGIATLVRAGFTLAEAVGLVTERPGAVVGRGGVLEVGAPADLLLYDVEAAHVCGVWRAGQQVA